MASSYGEVAEDGVVLKHSCFSERVKYLGALLLP